MKIIIDLSILYEEDGQEHLYVHVGKVYETELVPMLGMKLIDQVWKEARFIQSVIIDLDNGYYLLDVGDDTCKDKIECEQLKQTYHSHGWTRFLVEKPIDFIKDDIDTYR